MEINKIGLIPNEIEKGVQPSRGQAGEVGFDRILDQNLRGPAGLAEAPNAPKALKENLPSKASLQKQILFSNHAVDRMMSRGIAFSPTDLQRIGDAVQRASQKGSKDSLILMDDKALIVSVKNNTVVTVMDRSQLKENVFTNIDSTVVL